ncbi:MAG: L,D-transpeptidase family protein [Ferruginibacter sp.]
MKPHIPIFLISLILTCICSITACTQITPEALSRTLSEITNINKAAVTQFYSRLNYEAVWFRRANTNNRELLLYTLSQSPEFGLREKDYQYNYFDLLRNRNYLLQNIEDSLQAEIRFTDAALHVYSDIAYGNEKPALGYNGLNYKPGCQDIPALLVEHIEKNRLPSLPGYLSPVLPEVKAIALRLRWIQFEISDSSYREIIITSKKVNAGNKPLITKLYQLGVTTSVSDSIPDSLLVQQVKEAQRQFCLLADGVLRSSTLQELNVPLKARLQQLTVSLNYYRWLHCLTQNQSVIVVNIPAAYLKVYRNNEVLLNMRMVVGKKSTPTPTLTSKIDEVILYPYWHVPYSIATKELLPILKRNPGYINTGNYQVLNRAGKIIDPYSVNWEALSATNFPYLIRQSTGCDNALGLLKLNFYNPFGVYLHDTNNKKTFMLNKRYFSHGCMRMQKPMELGHLILENNAIAIDTLNQKGCLRNQSPITVPANIQMPVIVWYNPAGIDSAGRVLFYEDVYKKFSR